METAQGFLSDNFLGFLWGFFGAVVGGLFTLYASVYSIRASNNMRLNDERREILNLIEAMALELGTLWKMHDVKIAPFLEKLKPGEPFLYYYPLSQSYFIVYDSNAAKIGRIDDSHLRESIVVSYLKCKKVVDGLTYNNTLFQDWRQLVQRSDGSTSDQAEMNAKYKELCDYGANIIADHAELKTYVEETLALIAQKKTDPAFFAPRKGKIR